MTARNDVYSMTRTITPFELKLKATYGMLNGIFNRANSYLIQQ